MTNGERNEAQAALAELRELYFSELKESRQHLETQLGHVKSGATVIVSIALGVMSAAAGIMIWILGDSAQEVRDAMQTQIEAQVSEAFIESEIEEQLKAQTSETVLQTITSQLNSSQEFIDREVGKMVERAANTDDLKGPPGPPGQAGRDVSSPHIQAVFHFAGARDYQDFKKDMLNYKAQNNL